MRYRLDTLSHSSASGGSPAACRSECSRLYFGWPVMMLAILFIRGAILASTSAAPVQYTSDPHMSAGMVVVTVTRWRASGVAPLRL